jgi:hypothetical protein
MLSLKNILSPLVDKKNLITIILVASFFAVYRISGGRIHGPELPNSDNFRSTISEEASSEINYSEIDSISPGASQAKVRRPTNEDEKADRELTDAFGTPIEQSDPAPQIANDNPSKPESSQNDFDDIEKSLGLR